jgi:membrane protease YdiL (CAAX protease family)
VEKWALKTGVRDFFEVVAVLAFVVLIPSAVERVMVAAGVEVTGSNRIIATGLIFVGWALFTTLLAALNHETLSDLGLKKPESIARTLVYGVLTAAAVFAVVVGLEQRGYGADRLGDMAAELKGNAALAAQRIAISVLIVGFVEEFVFRGFLLLRLIKLLGGSRVAVAIALLLQAALFGLLHSYQHLYGIVLTASLALFFGIVYLALGRNRRNRSWCLRCCPCSLHRGAVQDKTLVKTRMTRRMSISPAYAELRHANE